MLIWRFQEHFQTLQGPVLACSPPLISETVKVHGAWRRRERTPAPQIRCLPPGNQAQKSDGNDGNDNGITRTMPGDKSNAALRRDVDISIFPHHWLEGVFFLLFFPLIGGEGWCGVWRGIVVLVGGLWRISHSDTPLKTIPMPDNIQENTLFPKRK